MVKRDTTDACVQPPKVCTKCKRTHVSWSDICKLELVAHLDNIKVDTRWISNYPKLCSGLGEVYQPYTIKLKPGAEPVSLKTPRKIPLLLMDKVKLELSRMEGLGLNNRNEEPT